MSKKALLLKLWTICLLVATIFMALNWWKNHQRKRLAHEQLQKLVQPPQLRVVAPGANLQVMELLQQSNDLSAFIASQPAAEDAEKALALLQKTNRQATIAIQEPQLGLVWVGNPAQEGQFPYQVGIVLSLFVPYAGRGYRCGGALIAATWVITAAHCFSNETHPEDIQVFAGQIKLSESSKPNCNCWYSVKRLARFPQYKIVHTTFGDIPIGDVVLLELDTAPSGNNIKPIAAAKVPDGAVLTKSPLGVISGWGKTSPSSDMLADTLQYGTVRIIADSKCSTAYGPGIIQANMICAKPDPADICAGDSGGPLVVQYGNVSTSVKPQYSFGVVSWKYPPGGCSTELPGVFSRLTEASMSDWVQQCISGLSCPSSFPSDSN